MPAPRRHQCFKTRIGTEKSDGEISFKVSTIPVGFLVGVIPNGIDSGRFAAPTTEGDYLYLNERAHLSIRKQAIFLVVLFLDNESYRRYL